MKRADKQLMKTSSSKIAILILDYHRISIKILDIHTHKVAGENTLLLKAELTHMHIHNTQNCDTSCGSLNIIASINSIRRYDFAAIDKALLEKVCQCGGGL